MSAGDGSDHFAGDGSDHFLSRPAANVDIKVGVKGFRPVIEQMQLYEAAMRRVAKAAAKAHADIAMAGAPAIRAAGRYSSGAYGLFQVADSGVVQRRLGTRITRHLGATPPPQLTIEVPPAETHPAKMERWARTYGIADFSVDWATGMTEVAIAGSYRSCVKGGPVSGTVRVMFAGGDEITFPAPSLDPGRLDVDEVERIIAAHRGIGVKVPPPPEVQADVFLGWRHWSVNSMGDLGAQFVHSSDWRGQEWTTARCTKGHETVPYPGCHCGFNAYFAPRHTVPGTPTVLGVMLGRRTTEVHLNGFRSREARPLVLVALPGRGPLLRAARRRTGVPVMSFGDAKAFALEHGSLVPDEAMPEAFFRGRPDAWTDPRDPVNWSRPVSDTSI